MDIKNIDNFRVYKSYLSYMTIRNVQIVAGNITTLKGLKMVITMSLENAYPDDGMRNNFIREMEMYATPPIDISEYDWLKENKRACTWVWLVVRQFEQTPNINNNFQQNKPYDMMGLKNITTNSTERFENIMKFFDLYYIDNDSKLNWLNSLKNDWSNINNKPNKIKWLNKNKPELCDWAWMYQLKAEQQIAFNGYFNPIDSEEKYYSLLACIDYTSNNVFTKNFIKNINHAFSQKKFRDKNKNKMPLNTYLKRKTKDKLKKLAAKQEINITEMIERLINSAHKVPVEGVN